MGHYPAGGSLYDFSHFAQMNQYKEQTLRKFDYLSAKENTKHYG